MSNNWPKVFRDPVHNLISFADTPCDRLLLELINTREVQRLRRIKQMGVTELVFPGANHSRFAHSLGVLHTARRFLDQLTAQHGQALPHEQRAFLLAAALLHDVGHGPFSHAFEEVTGRRHEAYTMAVIRDDSTEVHRCLRRFDPGMPEQLALFFDEDADEGRRAGDLPAYLGRIVSGQLDADRCDYLLRDSHATGTNYGDFDLTWMLEQLRPDPAGRRFYLTRKGLAAVETYLFARYHMYRTVYFHKTSRAAEVMLKLLFRRLAELIDAHTALPGIPPGLADAFSGRISLTSYLDFDDHTISEMLKSCTRIADGVLSRLADGLLNRHLYKALDMTGMPLSGLLAFDERAGEMLQGMGQDPRYSLVEDSASDTPYEPYHPDAERPDSQIYVESGEGRVVEISTISEALSQLMKTYTMMRYYVPGEYRDRLARLAADIKRGGWGMKSGNFWWLAAVVAAHDERRLVGRTRLQKTVKLLQRLDLPTDYLFTMFFYGPYSEGLFRDIGRCGGLGLLTEVEHPGSEGTTPTFVLQATPEAEMPEMGRWKEAVAAMQASDLVVLELAATYDAFREMGSDHADAVARLKHKKAGKWTEDRHTRAEALLAGLGLATT